MLSVAFANWTHAGGDRAPVSRLSGRRQDQRDRDAGRAWPTISAPSSATTSWPRPTRNRHRDIVADTNEDAKTHVTTTIPGSTVTFLQLHRLLREADVSVY